MDAFSKSTTAPRFQVPAPLSSGAEIALPERAARHVGVLRLAAGDAITLFTGEGSEFEARLTLVARSAVRALVGAERAVSRESPLTVTLAQCIASGDRMDLVLQKATELGVAAIIPIRSERAVVKLKEERAEKKLMHWRAVVAAACEQCGRNSMPEVAEPVELHTWLNGLSPEVEAGARLVLAPGAEHGLATLPRPSATTLASAATLLIGPEGGLAEHELQAARRAGFQPVRLGPRILRTETAPIAALTALQVLWGDLG